MALKHRRLNEKYRIVLVHSLSSLATESLLIWEGLEVKYHLGKTDVNIERGWKAYKGRHRDGNDHSKLLR